MNVSDYAREFNQKFLDLTQNKSWDELKKDLVMKRYPDNRQQTQAAKEMKQLVDERDVLDFVIYREAVKAIFPDGYYSIKAIANGEPKELPGGGYTLKSQWYEFEVMPQALPTIANKVGKCLIKIDAPGSRKLTSDIDTSISTKMDPVFSLEHSLGSFAVKNIKLRGPAFEKRVTNAVIDGFYSISEELCGKNSSISRDSNAYADTISNDAENYPKFVNNYETNPMIKGVKEERLFSDADFTKIFKENKEKKHTRELAASLFSLRDALSNEEWNLFKSSIESKFKELFSDCFWNDRNKELKFLNVVIQDWAKVFEMAEKLYSDFNQDLTAKINAVKPEYANAQRQLSEDEYKVIAMNRLYVELLETCANLQCEILGLQDKKKQLINQLNKQKNDLDNEEEALKGLETLHSTDNQILELIKQKKSQCGASRDQYNKLKKELQENITKTSKLYLDSQYMQIKANTFANEAYVCSSAVYIVVNGQKKEPVQISEQRLLASALQQVGFKLLHTKLAEGKKSPEQIAYDTAKYGLRIFNLIFGQDVAYSEKHLKVLIRGIVGNTLKTFTYLKSEALKSTLYRFFDEKELFLLNYQADIISSIKANDGILDYERPTRTLEFMKNIAKICYPNHNEEQQLQQFHQNEKSMFLSIAAKLIAIVFASKLQRKDYLWGQEPVIQFKTGPLVEQKVSTPVKESAKPSIPSIPVLNTPESLDYSRAVASSKDLQAEQGADVTTDALGRYTYANADGAKVGRDAILKTRAVTNKEEEK